MDVPKEMAATVYPTIEQQLRKAHARTIEHVASLPELAERDVVILSRIAARRIGAETESRQTVQSRVQTRVQKVSHARRAQWTQQLASARQEAAEIEAQMEQLTAMDYGNSRAAANLGLLGMLVSSVGATSSQGDVASLSARLASEPTTAERTRLS